LHTQIVGMRSLHSPMTSLKTSIKTITYLSDIGCLEIQGASLLTAKFPVVDTNQLVLFHQKINIVN
ncbi:hypothetical protein, partial [Escherichia coli]|uniref:hypothetical protein n=1 Tax=Escherichia coli TaxID=562 RepID=UPI00313338F6